jgi:bis(5'-nucleosidyl)-tetraphosphatase
MKKTTLSAGVVVVRVINNEHHYLLLRVFNYWDFPKGEVEPGEDPLSTAIREVEEETTLTGLNFNWGELYKETDRYGKGKIARYYLAESKNGEVSLPVSPELGHPEHHEFRWVSYRDAHKLLKPRLQAVLDWAQKLVQKG